MSAPFVAEIRIFPINFPPKGWADCSGQLLPISQNTALFSLLGTYYGGNGKTNFALPDLNGHLATHQGQGPGLQEWFLGQSQGSETVTLLDTEMPAHNHGMVAANTQATQVSADGAQLAKGIFGGLQAQTQARMYSAGAVNNQLNQAAIGISGSSMPHNNMMPYLTLRYCIAMQGVFPPRG
jgi:microcystin-dependent protein